MADRAQLVKERYSQDAAAYERLWAPVLRPLAQTLLDELPLRDAARVLDIGTGTGTLLRDIGRRSPSASVIGCDLALGMIALAPAEYARCVCEARALAFRENTFDVAVSTFAFQHVPEPERAFADVRRAMRAGGIFGILTWHAPIPSFEALDVLNAMLDDGGAGQEAAIERTSAVEDPDSLTELLSDAGFRIEHRRLDEQRYEMTVASFLERMANLGLVKRRIESLPDKAAFIETAKEHLRTLPPEAFVEPLRMIYTVARAV